MSDSWGHKHKYRAQAGEVRASYAYVFRIVLDDELFLVSNEHEDNLRFQPVGGGYRFDDASRDDVKRFFGLKCAPGTEREPHDVIVPEDNDFRLLLPAAGLESLSRFFNSAEEAAILTNLIIDETDIARATKAYRDGIDGESRATSADYLAKDNEMGHCADSNAAAAAAADQQHTLCPNGPSLKTKPCRPHIRYKIATSLSDSEVFDGIIEDTALMLMEQRGNGSDSCLIPDNKHELIEIMREAAKQCSGACEILCSRETVNDLRREFIEEMLESKIVPESMHKHFNEICYLYRGRHQEYFYDDRFGTYSYFVCDILELIPTPEQLTVLRYLNAHEHDAGTSSQYVFVKEDEVPKHLLLRSEPLDAVAFPPLADHTVKVLACNFDALRIPSAIRDKLGDKAPYFGVRIKA